MKPADFLMLLALAVCLPNPGVSQLAIVTNGEPQQLFSGLGKNLPVVIRNAVNENFDGKIYAQLWQTSSATAVRVGAPAVKEFQSLPGQTVLESVSLDFPTVKAETPFLVQWLVDTNRVLGGTDVLVYPTNLLDEFKPMLAGGNFGVLDPGGRLKPLLKKSGVAFLDLGEMVLEDFSGKLAIIGPFQAGSQMRAGLPQAVQRIANQGVAVVWILPPPGQPDEIKPSFYVVPEGKGAVVIVQPELVADFSANPRAQLNLIYFCKLALKPEPPALPNFASQP